LVALKVVDERLKNGEMVAKEKELNEKLKSKKHFRLMSAVLHFHVAVLLLMDLVYK
jgi:hypothetical protein